MKAKIAVILHKVRPLKNGEYPLALRVTHKGKRNYAYVGISCPVNLWDEKKNMPKRAHPNRHFIEEVIQRKTLAYQQMLLEQPQLATSPEQLIQAVENAKINQQLFPFLDELIDGLTADGRIGTARAYKELRRDLKLFTKNNNLLVFTDIDQRFLNRYESYFRSKGLADTTISYYLRTLQAVFNKAIKEKLVKAEYYPFREFKISRFNTKTRKRAITKEDVRKLAKLYIASDSHLYISQQYFLFSYYGQGMNFRDIAFLKWGDIREGRVFYKRAKTGQMMQFKLLAPAQAIVDRYRPQTAYNKEDYVFPILDKAVHITPTQIDNRLRKVLKKVNNGLKELANMAGITINLTMYVARHTYGTVLMWNGVGVSTISQAMGHSDTTVTQVYLKSFADEVIDAANEHLL
ncbi:MAG: site-specific integrase [Bacteroidota bacterium]